MIAITIVVVNIYYLTWRVGYLVAAANDERVLHTIDHPSHCATELTDLDTNEKIQVQKM